MMRLTVKNRKNSKATNVRFIAWFFIVIFSVNILYIPSNVYAGGPTQPEVQSFAPIGMDNRVNPFTGDFSYDIPLMEIEGYPLNLNYNAGISMDQEASWVGLGWNLNVGEVMRNLRGIPDDFSGDEIITERNMKENKTYSFDLGASLELFAIDNLAGGGINASTAVSYNNYSGWAAEQGFGLNFSSKLSKKGVGKLSAGLQFSGSSENGASFSPSLSMSVSGDKRSASDFNLGGNIGASMNSRAGLQQIGYGVSMSAGGKDLLMGQGRGSFNAGTTSFPMALQNNLRTSSFSGNFKLGFDAYALDPTGSISISFSKQYIPEELKKMNNPAYGYFNLNVGQEITNALLDFTRDNDGSFTKNTPFLPSTTLTGDVFSVRAQGIGGSFKGFRNDIGYVFDPMNTNSSDVGSIGFEAGFSMLFKAALDVNVSSSSTETSAWADVNNQMKLKSNFKQQQDKSTSYSLVEATDFSVDRDDFFHSQFNENAPVSFRLSGSKEDVNLTLPTTVSPSYGEFKRQKNYPQNVVLQTLTIGDLKNGFGVNSYPSGLITTQAKNHHLGSLIYLGNDGRRYVFDIPVYNTLQEDVTFAVGTGLNGSGPTALTPSDDYQGQVGYSPSAASKNNNFGIDNYYDSRTTPAYAHSFMLSSVLTEDYIDNDNVKGPSKNDFGNYVKFNYMKVSDFGWRNPPEQNQASFSEGLKSITSDDKANFNYGRKELMYVQSIESKNYVIVFHLENRADLVSVSNRNGGLNASVPAKRLVRIDKYSRIDYEQNGTNAKPIESVHFDYDYSLCAGNPTSVNGQGKLTLKKVYFTYQGSYKMKYSPYSFEYGFNPGYALKALDRWGTYAPMTGSGTNNPLSSPPANFEYPYTTQNKALADQYAAAWCLSGINLPSGGKMIVQYESDDYQYVQNKRADRMFMIAGVEDVAPTAGYSLESVSDLSNKNRKIYFKLLAGYDKVEDYVADLEGGQLYFRCLTEMKGIGTNDPENFEFISGYGKIQSYGTETIGGEKYGWFKLKGESLKDGEGGNYNPITKAAIQFGRLYLNEYVNDINIAPDGNDTEDGLLDFASALVNSIASFSEFFISPNLKIWSMNRGRKIVMNKSWIRLVDPTGRKLGGGHRVKRVLMYDNWNGMTGEGTFNYGQEYFYQNEDGTSSGVAENEPMIGADESPLRQPYFYDNKYRFAPDYNLYTDTKPFESQFPSPNVGYARVEIRNLQRAGVVRTATGKIVKEYYTAKDFPFKVERTELQAIPYKKSPLFGASKDIMHATQGFSIITNDMHGKEKKNSVFAENSTTPISAVEYFYRIGADGKLDNRVEAIDNQGNITLSEIGVKREAVADFRKSETMSESFNVNMNVNGIYAFIPITIPIPIPSHKSSKILFKSATLNKQVQQFGILKRTVAMENGASIETNNLVYDANSGQTLITQTINNFHDSIYSVTYPAYWKYEQMGMAYQNLGTFRKGVNIVNGNLHWNNASAVFVEGDELSITGANNFKALGWVYKVEADDIWIMDKQGDWITADAATITIIRSGRKNKQTEPMATMTTMSDPVPGIKTNNYSNVLNAGAIEFSQDWSTACECLPAGEDNNSVNPFLYGTKGHWRPSKSYTYLTNRTQSNYNGNTNIKSDGVFSTYRPYYYLDGSQWKVNPANWTFTSEVTQFSVNGSPVETKDAIGRYSSSLYSFNHTLQTSAAVNASLKQQLNLHFEDDESACGQQTATLSSLNKSSDAHTGRNSIEVTPGQPVSIYSNDISCAKPECSLALTDSSRTRHLQNSTGAVDFQYEVIYGNLVVMYSDEGVSVYDLSSQGGEVKVMFTDEAGCQLSKTILIAPQN